MAEQVQRVRFTGKRTGRDDMPIPGLGVVHKGDVIEVGVEEAERWTEPLPTGDGKEASDFTKVGGPTKVNEDEALVRAVVQREKLAKNAEEDDTTVMAHEPDKDSGTVEDFADTVFEADGTVEAQKDA